MEFTERSFTSRDGLALYFRDYGRSDGSDVGLHRPAILCLAGLTRNSKDFHQPALGLVERYRVICPDYRGRGQSAYDPHPENYRPETYLDDIRQLLCSLNVHRVVVIGTSMGGVLAMAMAVALPTVVVGVVLNDVGAMVPAKGLAPIIASLQSDRTFGSWNEAAEALRRGFPDLPAETNEEWLDLTKATFKERPDGRIDRDWDRDIVKPLLAKPLQDTDLWPYFRALRGTPTGVVRGALSHILTSDVLSQMAADRADLIYGTVDGVGHPPSLREPASQEVIDAVLARV